MFVSVLSLDLRTRIAFPVYSVLNLRSEYATAAEGYKSKSKEADAICDGQDVYIIGIMEHIEPAGIHSGDSNAVLPPFDLSDDVIRQIEEHTKSIAKAMQVKGLINIQFAIKNDIVYVIEANPRASRTVPFIAKAYDEPYVNYATKVMLGAVKVKDIKFIW